MRTSQHRVGEIVSIIGHYKETPIPYDFIKEIKEDEILLSSDEEHSWSCSGFFETLITDIFIYV